MKKIFSLFCTVMMTVLVFGQSYGILVNGHTYFAGESAGENEGFTQYLSHVQLQSGDYCQLYDASNNAAWVVTLNSYSVEGFALNNDRYEVTVDGCYDFYIKLKYGQDELYIGNGSNCGEGEEIPTGGEPEEFVGFDARTINLGEQIAAGLAKNLVNVTFEETSEGKYSVNLVEGGVEGSFSFGGVVFAYKNSSAGATAFKTYGLYIQPNGKDREVRIPLNAGEKANVILYEACEDVLVNGVSTNLAVGDNILTATEDGLVLKSASTKPKIQAVLPVTETAKFYITGDAALLGEELAWNPAAIKVSEDSYTFENLAAGDYKLKVTLDGTWGDGMVKGFSDLTTVADGLTADADGNICFTLAEAGDVVVTYTAEAFTLAGNFYVEPQPQECDWDAIEFLGDGSPEQTFGNQFKICKAGEQPNVGNIQKPGWAAETGIYVNFPSAVFGEISLAEGQYVIEGAGMLLYLSAFTQEYTEVTVNWNGNDIVFTDWEVSEDYILTPNNEAEGQEFMGEFTFAANDAFKVVKNNKEVWYPDGMGNDFVISEDGDYTVYFRPNGDGGEGWHYGYIYAAKKEATAISNTAADAEAVKVLNNGMLLIRKGNKTYNVMGQAVK